MLRVGEVYENRKKNKSFCTKTYYTHEFVIMFMAIHVLQTEVNSILGVKDLF